MPIHYGLYLSNYGKAISARSLAELAAEAETAGWDGFFLWDHILAGRTTGHPMVDPWVALAAMAMTTEKIRLGTSVTPLARRRPWKLARETVSVDHLSGGRLTLGVGLGEPGDVEFASFSEDPGLRQRARKLDEGLAILTGLWTGRPFSYRGEHFNLETMTFRPATFQQPRIPIWVGGYWPNKPPFRRAARYDGAFPLKRGGRLTPKDVRQILEFVNARRGGGAAFDIIYQGTTRTHKEAQQKIAPLAQAGLTWWLESLFLRRNDLKALRERVKKGPLKVA